MFPRFVTFLTLFETLRTPRFPLPFLFLSEEWAIATLSKDTLYDVQKRETQWLPLCLFSHRKFYTCPTHNPEKEETLTCIWWSWIHISAVCHQLAVWPMPLDLRVPLCFLIIQMRVDLPTDYKKNLWKCCKKLKVLNVKSWHCFSHLPGRKVLYKSTLLLSARSEMPGLAVHLPWSSAATWQSHVFWMLILCIEKALLWNRENTAFLQQNPKTYKSLKNSKWTRVIIYRPFPLSLLWVYQVE